MQNSIFLFIAAALLLAAVVVIVIFAVRIGSLKGEKALLEGKLNFQEEARKRIDEEREKVFESNRKQLEESFRTLSEQNSAGLRRQNAESITELLKPIQEKFTGFEQSVKSSQEKSVAQDASMRELLKAMMDQSRNVGEEARNLANALTGHSKVQGDFGEMLLMDLLKNSGLQEGVHFKPQGVLTDELGHEIKSDDGKTLIPDVIVYYPDDTEVIIDSKVSLKAYVNYMNATSVEERSRYAKEHLASIRNHIDELKTKDYASYIEDGKKKVDYNIMFIPMEGAFRLMLEESPTLWQLAKDSKVLIVSQMNLMIVLNMILMSWRQHNQEKNIEEVYKAGSELMSQLKNWMDSFMKIGDNLSTAAKAYNDAKSALMDSSQSVIKKIDKLEKLGLSPKRSKAKLKPGTRITGGHESIIPTGLSDNLESEED
ncbi:MAG: DNA recombination protein RmuC [Bacteroidales bacterium]|nr:DNA recombination protein RmuC [Bacteroidales bacterium]